MVWIPTATLVHRNSAGISKKCNFELFPLKVSAGAVWTYNQGVFMRGAQDMWRRSGYKNETLVTQVCFVERWFGRR